MNDYKIDPELNSVLPELSDADYKALEQSLLTDGFKGAPIMVWGDIIVDGHNRYKICKEHNIPFDVKSIEFESKEEAILWMVRQQIGRRSLTPLQRIQIVEKYCPFYKKKAKENMSSGGKSYSPKKGLKNSAKLSEKNRIDVRAELAKDADVSTDTYSKGLKILNSGNDELINETANGQKSINKAYNELKENEKKDSDNDFNSQELPKVLEVNQSDTDKELKDLKEIQRKEAAQKIKEVREEYGIESAEYEEAKAEQLNVEVRINELESNLAHDTQKSDNTDSTLTQIQKRYFDFLTDFQNDVDWLSGKLFYRDDEDVSGRTHSELHNCLEKFRSISDIMQDMVTDEFGCITIKKQK